MTIRVVLLCVVSSYKGGPTLNRVQENLKQWKVSIICDPHRAPVNWRALGLISALQEKRDVIIVPDFRKFVSDAFLLVFNCLLTTGEGALAQEENLSHPACEARSMQDPARLNIVGRADSYGILSPCQSQLSFYIGQNTRLDALEGSAKFTNIETQQTSTYEVTVQLSGPDGGLIRGMVDLPPLEGSCVKFDLSLQIDSCLAAAKLSMECPPVRILNEPVYNSISVQGDNLSVCRD